MILNLSLVTLVTYFTWSSNVDLLQAVKNSDPYIYYGLGDSTESEWENDEGIQRNFTVSNMPLGSKRTRSKISTAMRQNKKLLKYSTNTSPIAPEIYDNMVNPVEKMDPELELEFKDSHSTESEWENEVHTERDDTSSSMSLRSKRAGTGTSTSTKSKGKLLKYRSNTYPIVAEIDDNIVDSVRRIEQELELTFEDRMYYWENYEEEVTRERIEFLCKHIWVSLKPRLHFMRELTDEFKPDCDGKLILGPSDPSSNVKIYLGFFQYLPNLEGKTFFADILRCNCAYLEWKKTVGRYGTASHTLHYFHILKVNKDSYCVLTQLDKKKCRNLKIVGINHIYDTSVS